MSDNAEFLDEFREESLEGLEVIEEHIMAMEYNDTESIAVVFRAMHTIKGGSSFMELMEINTVAHQLENLLDETRSGERPITQGLIDLLLAGADALRDLIDSPDCGTDSDISTIMGHINNFTQDNPASPSGSYTAIEEPSTQSEANTSPEAAPSVDPDIQSEAATTPYVESASAPQPHLPPAISAIPGLSEDRPQPFGNYLIEQGLISEAQIIDALVEQHNLSQHPLRILQQEGLSDHECLQVSEYMLHSDLHPFHIAGQLGFTVSTPKELFHKQHSTRPPLGRMLTELGLASSSVIRQWLQCYYDNLAGIETTPLPATETTAGPTDSAPIAQEESVQETIEDTDNLCPVSLPEIAEITNEKEILEEFANSFNHDIRTEFENAFMELEQLDPEPLHEQVQKIYRDLHSLKGSFGFIHANVAAFLLHTMEECFSLLRDNVGSLDKNNISIITEAQLDALDHAWNIRSFILSDHSEEPYLIDHQTELCACIQTLTSAMDALPTTSSTSTSAIEDLF